MKISSLKKSSAILLSIFISVVSFGLFYTFQAIDFHEQTIESTAVSSLSQDTVAAAKTASRDSIFRALISSADKLYGEKAYEKCLIELQKAQQIKLDDAVLKERITKLNGLITTQKKLLETSQKTVASGDVYFNAKDYLNAKAAYQQAISQNPDDVAAQEKLRKTMDLLRSQKAQNILFDVAVAGADKLFQSGEFEKARQEYENASKLLPGDPYPKSKINEIIKIQVDRQVKDEEYAKAIAAADKFYAGKNFQNALLDYKKAGSIKPDEKYPQDKIKELTQLLAELKAKEDAYKKAIAQADLSFKNTQYPEAINAYKSALVIKPEQEYPRNRIREIEGILAKITNSQAAYENYIAVADSFYIDKQFFKARENYLMATSVKPTESYPREMVSKADKMLTGQEAAMARSAEEQYAAAIASGDKLLADKSYDQSKLQYQVALKLKAAEQYPKDKIAEIDKALAELALLKDRDARYDAAVSKGDQLLAQKSYQPARAEFTSASSLKPQESYPKEQITAIDKMLADLAAAKALDDKYAAAIASADKLLAAKTYDQARTGYQDAGTMKPEESYPKEKIAAIDQILADIAATKSLEENYKATIAKADQYLAEKSYDQAKAEYTKASGLKPAEQYPRTRITEIDGVLAAIAKQKALEDEYAAAIASGDKLLADKSYDQSKLQYQAALKLKAAEQYPKDKIAEIDKALAELALLKDRDAKYDAAVSKGDQLLAQKSYQPARAEFTNASSLKPQESYPKEQIGAIDKILADLAAAKALDDKYAADIASADKLFAAKTYDQARTEYQDAGTMKPEEAYPKEKIKEIDGILAEIKAAEDAYNASIASGDQLLAQKKYEEARVEYQNSISLKPRATYPKEKIAEINKALEDLLGKQKYYENLIAEADISLTEKDYAKAKDTYQQALGVFPEQKYPKQQINMITARVDSLYRANKSLYDKAVSDGDRFYNSFEFDKAVDAYTDAANFLPMEKYPREMIVKIRRTIAENAIADVLKETVTITSNTEKQFPFPPVNIASRKNNFVYIKIKNLSGKSFNVLMRYGKDKQANGGVVMRNLNIDGNVNERLVSVRDQDLWSREDNNWISLYPQGGDVEVSFIQVSRAKSE